MFKGCTLLSPTAEQDQLCPWPDCLKSLPKYRRRWCSDECGERFENNHSWVFVRHEALKRDEYKCVKCGSQEYLEVNHLTPRRGHGYKSGCWNHLEGLETLCRVCHAKTTHSQRWGDETVEERAVRKRVEADWAKLARWVRGSKQEGKMSRAASQYCGVCEKWVGIASTTITRAYEVVNNRLVSRPVEMHTLTCGHAWTVNQ